MFQEHFVILNCGYSNEKLHSKSNSNRGGLSLSTLTSVSKKGRHAVRLFLSWNWQILRLSVTPAGAFGITEHEGTGKDCKRAGVGVVGVESSSERQKMFI